MARQIIKWADYDGILFDTEEEAKTSDMVKEIMSYAGEAQPLQAFLKELQIDSTMRKKIRDYIDSFDVSAVDAQKWRNDCGKIIPKALRFVSRNDGPTSGGEQHFNSMHLEQLADELENVVNNFDLVKKRS